MAGLFINVNYIVVPIFLMLRDGDNWFKSLLGSTFLLNNLFVLAIVYAATALPFTIYLLSGYFATLAHDYEEAAYIDGAGYTTTMVKIIFPMAKPSIITIILFNFLSFWNEYIISMTLMNSAKGTRTLPVGLLNLMQAQQSAAQYGTMYAGLVLVMLPTLILYICVQKQLTQGMTVGGLKGSGDENEILERTCYTSYGALNHFVCTVTVSGYCWMEDDRTAKRTWNDGAWNRNFINCPGYLQCTF